MKHASLYLLGSLLLLALWTAASFLAGSFIVPTPWRTLLEAGSLLVQAHTWKQILITFLRVGAGFTAALISGAAVGLISGIKPGAEAVFRPLVILLQGVPPLLWAIPLILVLGAGHLSPILVIALICFPLVALNVDEGVKSRPRSLEQMLQVFAPGFRARLRELIVPHLRPFLGAAVKLGVVLGIKASVIGEYFGANNGIGFQIQAAYQSLQVRRLFAWGLLLILLILAANQLLAGLEQALAGRSRRLERFDPGAANRETQERLRNILASRSQAGIFLKDVCFAYPGESLLLDRIDLAVGPEEVAVISGDSGVGKTTLLNVTSGLLAPLSGQVERPQRLGLVFQDDRLLPWRSNAWNVAVPLIYSGTSVTDSLSFARFLILEAGLAGLEAGFPDELSGGMKKRLGFARCFSRFPEAILLDEPFAGLDAEARRQLWRKFLDLLSIHRRPALIVTHFPEEVPDGADCTFYTLAASDRRGKAARLLRGASARCMRWTKSGE